jgi:hypothetical protein
VTEATQGSRVGNDSAQQTCIQMNQNSDDESRMQDPEKHKEQRETAETKKMERYSRTRKGEDKGKTKEED